VFEESGIPTVIIMVGPFRHRAASMRLPRVVVTRHPMGRPMGAPGDSERHSAVLGAALDLLASARQGGTIRDLPELFRPGLAP